MLRRKENVELGLADQAESVGVHVGSSSEKGVQPVLPTQGDLGSNLQDGAGEGAGRISTGECSRQQLGQGPQGGGLPDVSRQGAQ